MGRLSAEEVSRIKRTSVVVTRCFKFGETEYQSRKELQLPAWIGKEKIYLKTFVVDGNIPWLIGKNTMKNLKMELDMETNRVNIRELGLEVRTREDRSGHLRICLGRKIGKEEVWAENLLSGQGRKKVLRKLHLQFGHPGFEKLLSLILEAKKEVGVGDMSVEGLREELKKISEECETCVKYKRTPPRPVVGMPWSGRFNQVISIDLGEYKGKRFMVMVDMATRFCQACWVNSKKPEEIIRKLMKHWVAVVGTPGVILSDNGLEWQNEKFMRMTELFGIKYKCTAAESPFSNGTCEKMVGLIKDAIRKMEADSNVDLETILYWAVSAKNCLSNKGGFSPNQLVFGKNPGLPSLIEEMSPAGLRDTHNEEDVIRSNLEALYENRKIHIEQESSDRIRRALNSKTREHKLEDAVIGDEVFYKREGEKEWRGPAKVLGRDGKTVIVKHGGAIREIARVHVTRIGKVKKTEEERNENREVSRRVTDRDSDDESDDSDECESCDEAENVGAEEEEANSEDDLGDQGEEELGNQGQVGERNEGGNIGGNGEGVEEIPRLVRGDEIKATSVATGEEKKFKITGLAGKRSSKQWKDSYNVVDHGTGNEHWVDLRKYRGIMKVNEEEVLLGEDRDEVWQAKMKELASWKENSVYDEVENLGQEVVSVRWIVTEKEKEGKKFLKARLVARGFEEVDLSNQNEAPTCSSEALRLCLSVILMNGWTAKTLDIKCAYLQGDEIGRAVFIKPPCEVETKKLWKLKKAVYGLKDAAKVWYEKVIKVVENLGGERSVFEPTLFIWKDKSKKVIGVMCSHVDDFCFGGTKTFEEDVIGKLGKLLKVGEMQERDFKYIGVRVNQVNNEILLEQSSYMNGIKVNFDKKWEEDKKMTKKEMKEYRGLIGKLNWVVQQTRPDYAFEVSEAGRTFQEGRGSDMKALMKKAKKMKKGNSRLKLEKVNSGELYWEVYTDASFGDVKEGSSQIGYIVSLKDSSGNKSPIQWKSTRAKRVARSTTEAEALAMAEAAEMTVYLDAILGEMVGGGKRHIMIKTDSKTLEEGLKSSTGTKSRRLRIDIAAIRQMIERGEVEIEWISKKDQIADVFTKPGIRKRAVRNYIGMENVEQKGGED